MHPITVLGFRLEDREGRALESDSIERRFEAALELAAVELMRNAHEGSVPCGDSFSDPRVFRFRETVDGIAVFRP